MKILVYTCNDFKNDSDKCLDLLHKSILIHNSPEDFDFIVMTNNNAIKTKFNYIYDDNCPHTYSGILKYSNKIPKNYDFYIYLDSDILLLDYLINLIPKKDFEINAAIENNDKYIYESDWHYNSLMSEELIKKSKHTKCFNAGQFSYKKNSRILDLTNNFIAQINFKEGLDLARFEQCCFNAACLDQIDKIDTEYLSEITTTKPEKEINKKLLHFTGFDPHGMNTKYQRMKNYIYNNF